MLIDDNTNRARPKISMLLVNVADWMQLMSMER